MNRADALKEAQASLVGLVDAVASQELDSGDHAATMSEAAQWAVIVLALRFASPSPIVVEVAR